MVEGRPVAGVTSGSGDRECKHMPITVCLHSDLHSRSNRAKRGRPARVFYEGIPRCGRHRRRSVTVVFDSSILRIFALTVGAFSETANARRAECLLVLNYRRFDASQPSRIAF